MTTQVDTGILYLNRKDVERACQEIDSVAIMRTVFRLHGSGQIILPAEAYLSWTNERDESVRSLNMPGYLGSTLQIAGTKIINSNPANPTHGLPRASGLTLLFESNSTRITCIMEGAYISSLRTASVTMLAAEIFGTTKIEHIAIIGAGVLAQAHIELVLKRRAHFPDVQYIHIFDLETDRITALWRKLAPQLEENDIALHIASSAEEAIRAAQLIVPATTTTVGYIQFDWLQPGACLVNISLDYPLPEVVLKADKVIVDDWQLVKDDPRRLLGRMYRAGQIVGSDEAIGESAHNCRRIDAQLGEVITGIKAGRQHADEIILVNPFGLAIEDVALAAQVYQAALRQQIGLQLER